MLITPEKFSYLTGIVIDNFEGGYYHPDMLSHFKASDQDVLRASGETMFGLDRKAGAQLAQYSEWKVFWDTVDKARLANPSEWKYQGRGGKDGPKLKELASQIMFKWFTYLANKYILVGSMDEIANDDRLIIHFSYGCWNGELWFKRYSDAINKAILQYDGNKQAIFNEAIKERTEACKYIKVAGKWVKTIFPNRAIRQQGQHMMELFAKLHL